MEWSTTITAFPRGRPRQGSTGTLWLPIFRGVAVSNFANAEAVLALHRFGMGPRPGSVAAIEADPRGALIAELERPSVALPAAAALPSTSKAFRTVQDADAKRQAQTIVATRKQQEAKRQQMSEAPAMMEGAEQGVK